MLEVFPTALHFEVHSTLECLLFHGVSTYNLDLGGVPNRVAGP